MGMSATKTHSKKGGQILVLMALFSTTLVILFGMVVGIGHIIQAKMNLQNAVDLAAMSGASRQARYMNHVALVNYRLRQNYKFQLYDFYITASRFNRGLRQTVMNSSGILDRVNKNETAFGICQQSKGFNPNFAGSSGTKTDDTTDFCQNVVGSGGVGLTIPPIVPSPVITLNPALIAANLAVVGLSQKLRSLCSENSGVNKAYFDIMVNALDKRQRHQVRELIGIIDEFDKAFGTIDLVDGGREGDATIYRTFFDNLTSANKTGNMELRWLNPTETRAFRVGSVNILETKIFDNDSAGGDFGDYFERNRINFSFPYIDFGKNCSVVARAANTNRNTIIGLARTRAPNGEVAIPMVVALQATVTPNILFWPRGLTPTLVAVGAAKAFGSRIGPPFEMTYYETTGRRGVTSESSTLIGVQGNMSFYPGDVDSGSASAGPMPGIGHKTILKYLFNSLFNPGNGPGSGRRDYRPSVTGWGAPGDCDSGGGGSLPFICLALAPTLYEGLFFNAYQFPPERISSPLLKAGFPLELPIKVSNPYDYLLPDRQSGGLTDAQARSWHATTFIGGTPTFRTAGKPVFFADTVSSQSSWSPDFEIDLTDLDPSKGESRPGSPGVTLAPSRQGYSIKLVALREVCDLMKEGGKVSPPPLLSEYCSPGSSRYLFQEEEKI